jgi:aminomethyltransferase
MPSRTPLYQKHVDADARMVVFADWEMPVQYSGVIDEHRAVRKRAGLFDVSHMGEVVFRGSRAMESLDRLFTNDLRGLADGQARYGCICRESGGIVDDVIVYRRAADDLLVCVNAANRRKDFEWLEEHAGAADVRNESDEWAQIALQGPLAHTIGQRLTHADLSTLKPYHFAQGDVAGVRCLIARTGYTGEDGFEFFCPPDDSPKLWDALMDSGQPDGLLPAGLGARDSLRLEMAYRLYGSDMDDGTTPLEAGLAWVVKLEKGDFLGQRAMQRQKAEGLARKLAGFVLVDPGIPRHGYDVMQGDRKIGTVTSGTRSPSLGLSIGLAYVPPDLAAEGSPFSVAIRGRPAMARAVKTPFVERQ